MRFRDPIICCLLGIFCALCAPSPGDCVEGVIVPDAQDRYGMSVSVGTFGDYNRGKTFVLVSGFVLLDYERVWPHRAPEDLRFRVEASLGGTGDERYRPMVSAGIMAHHYLPGVDMGSVRPYIEAGVGLIYSEYRIEGQAMRLNFNPQAGVGIEVGSFWFAALRVHHMSNGGLHRDNRGVNSGVVQMGRYF